MAMVWSLRMLRRDVDDMGQRMRGFERGDDAFDLAQSWKASSASLSVALKYFTRP